MPPPLTTSSPVPAIYAHVPFCHSLCGYCDFFSVVWRPDMVTPLVDALLTELARATTALPLEIETIFVGGGTPTTLAPRDLRRLCTTLADLPRSTAPLEFTVEANPATVTDEIAATLAETGVNRVSIGAQSFQPDELRVLERLHNPAHVPETVRRCRAAGISQVSLDLIFAVPGQSLAAWRDNLDQALALEPDHLSCYALTFEPGTRLHARREAGRVHPLENDLEADMYALTIETLAAAGYEQYEISNFAKPGAACRHNLIYWRNEQYLGIGPAAAGSIADLRYKNVPDLHRYVDAIRSNESPVSEEESGDLAQLAADTIMMGLRLREGISRAAFRRRFGRDPTEMYPQAVARNLDAGLLAQSATHLRLTEQGLFLADSVISDFL